MTTDASHKNHATHKNYRPAGEDPQSASPSAALSRDIKDQAARLGFTLAGISPAVAPPGLARLDQWLEAGYAGQMRYLPDRAEAYRHPRHVLDGVRSIVMLAMNYHHGGPREPNPTQGRVSRYASGSVDYHDLVHERLKSLAGHVRRLAPEARVRGVVDTAPLMEREFAQLAGLGWLGKNTLLINKHVGSWLFLAALLTDLDLVPDAPHDADHCGTCRACLDACPTNAFPQPYVLDARRCISYLTIELRGPIPGELRDDLGSWVFGCDVCQDVCPWNRQAPPSSEAAFEPRDEMNPLALTELFTMDEAEFQRRFRHTPLWRPKRRGLLRNAALALGNRPSPEGLLALIAGLDDSEPLVRSAAAWALGRYDDSRAAAALAARSETETDADVLAEIAAAVSALAARDG
jgi:epoxyqueuosine reductase